MARSAVVIEVKEPDGDVVPSGSVQVNKRSDGTAATLYAQEVGGSTVSNPRTVDSSGRSVFWVDRGEYNAVVSGTGITTYTIPLNGTPAGNKDLDATWAPLGLDPTILTNTGSGSTPSSPTDGDRFIWAPALADVIPTEFRYNASGGTYKWQAFGGPGGGFCASTGQLGARSQGTGVLFNLHTGWDTGNLPLFTCPFAGEYDMEAFAMYSDAVSPASPSNFMLGPSFSSATTTPSTDVRTRQPTDAGDPVFLWFKTRVTAAAGDIIGAASTHTSSGTRVILRWLAGIRIVPVRVA